MQNNYEMVVNFLKRFWYLLIIVGIILLIIIICYCHNKKNNESNNLAMLNSTKSNSHFSKTITKTMPASVTSSHIYVEIKGAVNRPGIYLLSKQNQRLFDALQQAGGLQECADTRKLNLAQQLKDQDSFYIPKKGEKIETSDLVVAANHPTNETNSNNSSNDNNKINLNTATIADLQKLSGVGPKKAEKIINYRNEIGKFKTVDDLKQVAGIGEKTLEMLKPNLCV